MEPSRDANPGFSATVAQAEDHLARGYEALASGDWPGAREAFAGALTAVESPEALDGVALAERLNDSAGIVAVFLVALLFPLAWLLVGSACTARVPCPRGRPY